MTVDEQNPRQFPVAMVNITNKCTLRCKHCFVFRDANPASIQNEMDTKTMLEKLAALQEKHGIETMLWMGGEPLLRPDVLERGIKIFEKNHITTNGTIDLIDFPDCIYVVSLDGPPPYNDAIRGSGTYEKVMRTIGKVPETFGSKVMSQCVVTAENENMLEDLVTLLRPTRFEGMTFSFYVPPADDESKLTWHTTKRRDLAVREVIRLKEKYPDFIWNSKRTLELTLSENCRAVTQNCPSLKNVLPLYLDGEAFTTPFCCYGNDVDCDLCGAWVVFYIASLLEKAGVESYGDKSN